MKMHGGVVVEVDVKGYCDAIDHNHLTGILRQRVRDGVLLRLIGKWLNAGVMEEGCLSYPESGTPQGGVISPLLANVFLHEVLDTWFEREVVPRLHGRGFLIRFADDFVMCFDREEDAQRVMAAVAKRLAKYGLTVHPTKTRLVPFRRPPRHLRRPASGAGSPPGTFDLLGFTHYWGRSLRGNWAIMRQTASKRLHRSLRNVGQWCRVSRHRPLREQHEALVRKVQGHFQYYGITGNGRMLNTFRFWVYVLWRKWLARRSRHVRGGKKGLDRCLRRFPLPNATIPHSVYAT